MPSKTSPCLQVLQSYYKPKKRLESKMKLSYQLLALPLLTVSVYSIFSTAYVSSLIGGCVQLSHSFEPINSFVVRQVPLSSHLSPITLWYVLLTSYRKLQMLDLT